MTEVLFFYLYSQIVPLVCEFIPEFSQLVEVGVLCPERLLLDDLGKVLYLGVEMFDGLASPLFSLLSHIHHLPGLLNLLLQAGNGILKDEN